MPRHCENKDGFHTKKEGIGIFLSLEIWYYNSVFFTELWSLQGATKLTCSTGLLDDRKLFFACILCDPSWQWPRSTFSSSLLEWPRSKLAQVNFFSLACLGGPGLNWPRSTFFRLLAWSGPGRTWPSWRGKLCKGFSPRGRLRKQLPRGPIDTLSI